MKHIRYDKLYQLAMTTVIYILYDDDDDHDQSDNKEDDDDNDDNDHSDSNDNDDDDDAHLSRPGWLWYASGFGESANILRQGARYLIVIFQFSLL